MTHGSILAFFGDAQAAQAAYGNLQRAGYTQIALITRAAGEREADKNKVAHPNVVRPQAPRVLGAALKLSQRMSSSKIYPLDIHPKQSIDILDRVGR